MTFIVYDKAPPPLQHEGLFAGQSQVHAVIFRGLAGCGICAGGSCTDTLAPPVGTFEQIDWPLTTPLKPVGSRLRLLSYDPAVLCRNLPLSSD